MRIAGAVEDVVGDLERDAEREPEAAEARVARAEQARGLEELPGLERDPLEVRVDRSSRVGGSWRHLEGLAARERETGVGEDANTPRGRRSRRARRTAREEVVAGRPGRPVAVRVPGSRAPPAERRAVDQVVVDERRRVHELDRDAAAGRSLAVVADEEDEQRPHALAARVERLGADRARRRPGALATASRSRSSTSSRYALRPRRDRLSAVTTPPPCGARRCRRREPPVLHAAEAARARSAARGRPGPGICAR